MRLLALAGARNGHTAIYPYDQHPRPLHVFPLRLYAFPTGMHVIAAPGREALAGARLTAIDDVPSTGSSPRCGRSSRATTRRPSSTCCPSTSLTEEVLVGLGLIDGGSTRFGFADGRTETIAPVTAVVVRLRRVDPRRASAAGRGAARLAAVHRAETQWLTSLDRGRAVYLGYHLTTDETYTVSRRLLALAPGLACAAVVVDIRLNHGGNNMTYGALLDVIGRLSKMRSVSLLIGRATFSASGNFAADVDALPRVRLIGEATGGAPSQWGDATTVELPSSGLIARVATIVPALRQAERADHPSGRRGAAHRSRTSWPGATRCSRAR